MAAEPHEAGCGLRLVFPALSVYNASKARRHRLTVSPQSRGDLSVISGSLPQAFVATFSKGLRAECVGTGVKAETARDCARWSRDCARLRESFPRLREIALD